MYRLIGMSFALSLLLSIANAVGAAEDAYLLRYKLNAGEQLHYEVTHLAKTKTRIIGTEEVTSSHTISNRHWDIRSGGDNITFANVLDSVELTQQQEGEPEVRWSSVSGDKPPIDYERLAEQIGDAISTITIDRQGHEQSRDKNHGTKTELGMGSLTLGFPEKPVAIGQSWSIPRTIKVKDDQGFPVRIKIRERYTLEKVRTGVATISVASEPLTPLRTDSIRSQVVQQLSNGEIRFDIDNGRMLSKQLDWDETVVGFQGPNSLMEYRARFTERLVDEVVRTAKLP